jgi:iron complex outermembrane receptor protein
MLSRPIALSLAALLVPQLYVAGIAVAQPATPATPPETPPAEAAQPAAEPAAEEAAPKKGQRAGEEEIVVTGSRIRRKDLTTPAPITVISKETVQASGRVTIGDFLQSLPEQASGLNTQQNNGGSGATRIDLRGLGNQRTLVLINGRRLVNTGTGGQSGVGVDLNTVPTAAVERIEILKDGASAVYGSDAIAGVVNIITRKTFNGVEANGYAGVSTHGDGAVYDVNATAGVSGDLGSILFSAGYYDQQPVFAGDRGFSQYQQVLDYSGVTVTNIGSSRAPAGRVTGPGSGGNALWQRLANRYGCTTGNCSLTYDPTVPDNWRPFNAAQVAPAGDLYNFQPINYDITPSKRISLYTAGNAKVSEYVRAFFEASFVNRQSQLQLAPEPLIIGAGGAAVTISANNLYNPFGRDFTTYSKRLTEFGPRTYAENVDTFRVVTGLNGTISTWAWDVSLNYGQTQWAEVDRGHITTSRLQNAIGPSDANGNCVDGQGRVIAGCVPLDLFHGEGAITSAMAGYLTFPLVARITNELTSVQANFGGELPFRLFSERPVGLAVGYEYRFELGSDIPDPVSAAGESTGNNRSETGGHFYVNEGYGELSIPIVSGVSGAETVEATAAVRVFNYNTSGTDATYKFGGRWSIIRDLTLRGTYSTAFRAPSITDLFQGATDNFPSVRDPCANLTGAAPSLVASCVAAGVPPGGTGVTGETQIRTRNSGNVNLQPETAKIWTAGVVIEPRYVRGLSVVVDYYHITIDQAIQTLSASFILQSCYLQGNAANCAKVHRSPIDSSIDRVDDFLVNIGHIETAGVDLGIRYNLPTEYGRFVFGFDGTWLQFYNVTQPDGTIVHARGNFDNGALNNGIGGVFPAFKALASLLWNYREFGAGATERFVGSFTECAFSDNTSAGGACYINPNFSRSISAYYQTDVFVSYDLKTSMGKTTLGAGVRNLFNSAPPRIYSAFTPTSDATGYDFMGRFFYGRITQRF